MRSIILFKKSLVAENANQDLTSGASFLGVSPVPLDRPGMGRYRVSPLPCVFLYPQEYFLLTNSTFFLS